MIKVDYKDNKHGTIIKIVDENGIEKKYAYDIMFWRKIPKNESIADYCYSQLEPNLKTELSRNNIATNIFCSGTCAAMILAITYADKKITPINILYWGDDGDEFNRTLNWDNGLKMWEQDDHEEKDKQVHDNRDVKTWTYGAIDGSRITTEEEYLKNIKIYLSAELPVVIEFPDKPHFVVVVGVESNVKLEDATFEQLVIYEPYWEKDEENEKNKIVTIGESQWKDYKHSYRLITPYPIVDNPNPGNNEEPGDDENEQEEQSLVTPDNTKLFVADEKGEKTHDPYYIDPVRKSDESIVPAKQGRPLKKAIEAVNYYYSTMPEDEKQEIIKGLIKVFTGEDVDAVYENLTVFRSGEYVPREGVTAFKKVTAAIPIDALGVSKNGTYYAGERGLEGFDQVTVNVPDRSDEVEKYKELWLKEIGKGDNVETDIPKPGDPDDPDHPGGGGNYVFENAIDAGGLDELKKYFPMLGEMNSIDIVEINGGLALHIEKVYYEKRTDIKLTVTNLKNGKSASQDSHYYTGLDINTYGWKMEGMSGTGSYIAVSFRANFGFSLIVNFDAIDFKPPANWDRHYALI